MSQTLTHEQKLCQTIAEAYWQAATSNDHAIANWKSPTYRALQRAFLASVRTVYGLGARRAERVLDLLSELGPNDGAYGTSGYGVASYVEYVRTNRP
jgi:hypothetical protein